MSDIVKVEDVNYPVLNADNDIAEFLAGAQDVLGEGEEMSAFDLEQINLPTGGGLSFTMADGSSQKSITGIIVASEIVRGYWPGDYSGGEPPQCQSPDGVTGYGDPGGACAQCQKAVFGNDGEAPECKKMRRIFLLREGAILPSMISLPPTSLKPAKKYLLGLLQFQLKPWHCTTEFTLEKAQNAAGIDYATICLSMDQELPEDAREQMEEYHEQIQNLTTVPVREDEYSQGDGVDL